MKHRLHEADHQATATNFINVLGNDCTIFLAMSCIGDDLNVCDPSWFIGKLDIGERLLLQRASNEDGILKVPFTAKS